MSDFYERLDLFLKSGSSPYTVHQLTQDASTREYFRVFRDGTSFIACVYPEPFDPAENEYLEVTRLFLECGLPVAELYRHDGDLGVIAMEDMGDVILRDVLLSSDEDLRETLIGDAIKLIAQIQKGTETASATGSVAGRRSFDEEKLLWELNFFLDHYFTTYRKAPLSDTDQTGILAEFTELARDLGSRAEVLCHRDFHAANLMVDQGGGLHIIDHQDARIGTASYDLVSLLLDRVTEPPPAEWLAEKRKFFLSERERVGLPPIDEEAYAEEFRLQTIQRCLKAVGTFSFQSVNRGKTYFVPFIKPMFQIVLRAIENIDRFPTMRRILASEANDRDADSR